MFTAGVSGRLSDVLLTLGNASGATDSVHVVLTGVDQVLATLTCPMSSGASRSRPPPFPFQAPTWLTFSSVTRPWRLEASTPWLSRRATRPATRSAAEDQSTTTPAARHGARPMEEHRGLTSAATRTSRPTCCRPATYRTYCLNGRFLNLLQGQPDSDQPAADHPYRSSFAASESPATPPHPATPSKDEQPTATTSAQAPTSSGHPRRRPRREIDLPRRPTVVVDPRRPADRRVVLDLLELRNQSRDAVAGIGGLLRGAEDLPRRLPPSRQRRRRERRWSSTPSRP